MDTTSGTGSCYPTTFTYTYPITYYPPQPSCYKCKCEYCCWKESCANKR